MLVLCFLNMFGVYRLGFPCVNSLLVREQIRVALHLVWNVEYSFVVILQKFTAIPRSNLLYPVLLSITSFWRLICGTFTSK